MGSYGVQEKAIKNLFIKSIRSDSPIWGTFSQKNPLKFQVFQRKDSGFLPQKDHLCDLSHKGKDSTAIFVGVLHQKLGIQRRMGMLRGICRRSIWEGRRQNSRAGRKKTGLSNVRSVRVVEQQEFSTSPCGFASKKKVQKKSTNNSRLIAMRIQQTPKMGP